MRLNPLPSPPKFSTLEELKPGDVVRYEDQPDPYIVVRLVPGRNDLFVLPEGYIEDEHDQNERAWLLCPNAVLTY